jgi:hypothetical protein
VEALPFVIHRPMFGRFFADDDLADLTRQVAFADEPLGEGHHRFLAASNTLSTSLGCGDVAHEQAAIGKALQRALRR